jgi:SSS family solute:Na+ symporter
MSLTFLDWMVVALFVGAILALGFSAKLRDSSVLQYLAAGRNLSLRAFVATLVSTWYGGILGVGETVSFYGFGAWLLIGVPYYVFAVFYAVWLAPRIREAKQLSLPERLAMRWGESVGVVGALLVLMLAVPAAHVLMLGVLVQQLTGWGLEASVIVSAVIGIALLYKGGLLADVRVGLLAFVMMYVGFAAIVFFCLANYPPAATFAHLDAPLKTFTGGVGWPVIVSFFILGAWTIVDPAFHQRVTASASPSIGRKGILVSVGFWFLFDVLSITTAMYALALLDPLPEKLAIYPALAQQVLPPGLKALFLCGMLGTITSAMVGYTLVSGATIGREIFSRLGHEPDDARVRAWIRGGVIIAMLLAVGLALQIGSVVDLWYSWSGVTVGALLWVVLLSYASPQRSRSSRSWVLAAISVSAASSMVWLIYCLRTNNPFGTVVWLGTKISLGTLLPGLVISGSILAIGEIVARRKAE